MALILNLETSTHVCSVSLSDNDKIIALRESFEDKTHASLLTVFVEEVLAEAKVDIDSINAVSVSQGPGSYTGLRIGVSVAKGICYAAKIPLIAIDTLKAMALMARDVCTANLYCSMIDARRLEVYSELFNKDLDVNREIIAEVISETSYFDLLSNNKIAFYGNGADKLTDIITHNNAFFIPNIYPTAKYSAILANEHFKQNDFKDIAYFEPFYLKDFVAIPSKKRMF